MLRKNRSALRTQAKQLARNSMIPPGSACDKIIQLSFGIGCFRGKDVRNLDSNDSLSMYNFLCSLFSFSLREFDGIENDKANILVLIDATKIPLKALRIILRACQSALAYKIRQAIIVEPEGLFGQQRIGIDILLDCYDFKTTICPKSKLCKYLDPSEDLHDLCGTLKKSKNYSGWMDIKQEFNDCFMNGSGERNMINNSINLQFFNAAIILAGFLKKDNFILINLVENDFDFSSITGSLKSQNVKALRKRSTDSMYSDVYNKRILPKYEQMKKCAPQYSEANNSAISDVIEYDRTLRRNSYADSNSSHQTSSINEQQNEEFTIMKSIYLKESIEKEMRSVKTNMPTKQTPANVRRKLNKANLCEISSDPELKTDEKTSNEKKCIDEKVENNNTACLELCMKIDQNERINLLENSAQSSNLYSNFGIEKIVNQEENTKEDDLGFLSIVCEQNRKIDEILTWILTIEEVKLTQLLLLGMPTTQPCYTNKKIDIGNKLEDSIISPDVREAHLSLMNEIDKITAECTALIESSEKVYVGKLHRTRVADGHQHNINENFTVLEIIEEKQEVLRNQSKKLSIKIHNLRASAKSLETKILYCTKFRFAIAEFYKESDELLGLICTKEKLDNLTQPEIEASKNAINEKYECGDKCLNEAVEAGQAFAALWPPTSDTKDEKLNGNDRIEFTRQNLFAMNCRWKRCSELKRLKTVRLTRLEQIIQCEEFGNQIVEKINSASIEQIRRSEKLLNKNNKSLYDYADQLIHIAYILRKLNGQTFESNAELRKRLDKIWKKANLNTF